LLGTFNLNSYYCPSQWHAWLNRQRYTVCTDFLSLPILKHQINKCTNGEYRNMHNFRGIMSYGLKWRLAIGTTTYSYGSVRKFGINIISGESADSSAGKTKQNLVIALNTNLHKYNKQLLIQHFILKIICYILLCNTGEITDYSTLYCRNPV
jgi:hypothetical protein